MIPKIHAYTVKPNIPERLKPLEEIANNMWWCWNQDAIGLLYRMDNELWADCYHDPVLMLGRISQERLETLLKDEAFLSHMDRVKAAFDAYMNDDKTWYAQQKAKGKFEDDLKIAYFSAEYGIHESIRNYSGGLGCLSGDHLKSASDLGIPLIGVGLVYRLGYFQQYLSSDGWQQEEYPINDFYNMPLELQRDANGDVLYIDVPLPGRPLYAQIWKLQVGRIPLYLLDANIERNAPEDREITNQLYGGDREMRIKQEVLLGVGGIRALEGLGLSPTVTHINEGHAAFASLERIRLLLHRGLPRDKAYELVQASNVFTTHTPVPAGNEVFSVELIDKYMSWMMQELGMTKEEFLTDGNEHGRKNPDTFSMTILALKYASYSNGVAALHGVVARSMWQKVWPGVPRQDLPIGHVTNGVHIDSWLSNEMGSLYERYIGPRFRTEPWDEEIWARIDQIPDAEIWRSHERRRERLVAFARRRLAAQLDRRGAPETDRRIADEVLDPEVLTIGFARRFATYKRATLLFRDLDRLDQILNNADRPIQILMAGKAHPHDTMGKELIKLIHRTSRMSEFAHRIVFLENYDMCVGRYLVQGVDIWLNNPRRPLEASGTSGMKVSMNGGLNCSILDGWWDEGYAANCGWAIGHREEYLDTELQDEVEAAALYELLEKEVAKVFYDRGTDGVPNEWVSMMKEAIKQHAPFFNTDRMVQEYSEKYYFEGAKNEVVLNENDGAKAEEIAKWRKHLQANWNKIQVDRVEAKPDGEITVGGEIPVEADIVLGSIEPDNVAVDLYYGPIDSKGEFHHGNPVPMKVENAATTGEARYRFVGKVPCASTGRNAFAVRVLPRHDLAAHPYEPGLITWG